MKLAIRHSLTFTSPHSLREPIPPSGGLPPPADVIQMQILCVACSTSKHSKHRATTGYFEIVLFPFRFEWNNKIQAMIFLKELQVYRNNSSSGSLKMWACTVPQYSENWRLCRSQSPQSNFQTIQTNWSGPRVNEASRISDWLKYRHLWTTVTVKHPMCSPPQFCWNVRRK